MSDAALAINWLKCTNAIMRMVADRISKIPQVEDYAADLVEQAEEVEVFLNTLTPPEPSVEEVPDADVEYCNRQAAEYSITYNNAPMAHRYERMARRLAKLRGES